MLYRCLENINCLKTILLVFLCHYDHIKYYIDKFKLFWNCINVGLIWSWNSCDGSQYTRNTEATVKRKVHWKRKANDVFATSYEDTICRCNDCRAIIRERCKTIGDPWRNLLPLVDRWQMAVAYEATLGINLSRHHHQDSEGPWQLSSRLIVSIGAGQVAGGWEGPQIIAESVNMIIPPLDPPSESATKLNQSISHNVLARNVVCLQDSS